MPAAPEAPPVSPGPSATPPIPAQLPSTSVPPSVSPGPPPKPGSAKAAVLADLEKFAAKKGVQAPPDPAAPPAPKGGDEPPKPGDQPPKPGDEPPAPKPGDQPPPPAPPADPKDKKGTNPWKLVDELKLARTAAETKLAELQKLVPDPAAVQQQIQRLEAAEKKAVELEKIIAFNDYQQSQEFKEKYVQPYEDAWKKYAKDLTQIRVKVPGTEEVRQATPDDLLQLVNLPLGEAQAVAQEAFGPLAERVMSMRDKLRDLFDAQGEALAKAKENGTQWKKEQAEKFQSAQKELRETVGKIWTTENQNILKDPVHGKWLTPVEGDEEVNTRLQRGFALSEEAFKLDPFDPKLSPDQRARAAKLHSALYNRAAAYSRLVLENSRLAKKLDEVTKERDGFKNSQPPRTPTPPGQNPPGELSGKARLQAELQKIAKPA